MTDTAPNLPSEELPQQMKDQLDRMEKFISRRFDEISTEIHATCQMLDMAEAGIGSKFSEILGVLSAVTFHGDGTTPHNVGVELNAVVKTSEDAANRILDAAEAIAGLVKKDIDWSDGGVRQDLLDQVKEQTDNILVACAFQDLTGQRIGKTLENIRKAEEELSETLKKMGLNIDFSQVPASSSASGITVATKHTEAASQDDIDALFS